jgi:hypothetical protein
MKSFILLAFLSVSSLHAFAADLQPQASEKLYYDCVLAQELPTGTFTVKLYASPTSAQARIETTLNRLGNNDVKNYPVVRHTGLGRIGAPREYVGTDATFSINLTVSPLPDNKRTATLLTRDQGQDWVQNLICELSN